MIVELRTTVARTDDDWLVQVLAKRFKDVFAEGFDVGYNLCMLCGGRIKRVVDAITTCGS